MGEVLAALIIVIPIALLAFIELDLSAIAKALKKQNEMYRLVNASYLRGMEIEKE